MHSSTYTLMQTVGTQTRNSAYWQNNTLNKTYCTSKHHLMYKMFPLLTFLCPLCQSLVTMRSPMCHIINFAPQLWLLSPRGPASLSASWLLLVLAGSISQSWSKRDCHPPVAALPISQNGLFECSASFNKLPKAFSWRLDHQPLVSPGQLAESLTNTSTSWFMLYLNPPQQVCLPTPNASMLGVSYTRTWWIMKEWLLLHFQK